MEAHTMKFKWIDLQNYAGIYNGMGLNQIRIDFTKCKSNKIIIRGDNGSGKSTLIDAIGIMADANDKFIPGMEARKSCCITDGTSDYVIRYIHPVNNNGDRGTTKGYITKTFNGVGVELNMNGNISSCKEILFNEFNLDANFISLSQLSAENKGLAYLLPSARKKLVNSIIDVLEVYNNIHKVLNKKSSIFKSTINSLTYKIDAIGDETSVQLNLKAVQNRIASLEKNKEVLLGQIAEIKIKIEEANRVLLENNYDTIVKQLVELSKDISYTDKEIQKELSILQTESIDQVPGLYEAIHSEIIQLEASIDMEKHRIPTMLADRESDYRKLQDKQSRLNELQMEYNYMDMKAAMETAQAKMQEYEQIFHRMKLMNINMVTKEEFNTAMDSLRYLKDSADNVISNYTPSLLQEVLDNRNTIKSSISQLNEKRAYRAKLQIEVSALQREVGVFETKRSIAAQLINRPSACKIDDCPYIKSAVEIDSEYPETKYQELLQLYAQKNEELEGSSIEISYLENVTELNTQFEAIERELKSKMVFIKKLPVRPDFVESFLYRIVNGDRFDDISDLYAYVDCGNLIEEYKMYQENLHTYQMECKVYESKNEIIESILSDVEYLTEKTNELANSIDSTYRRIEETETKLESFQTIKSKIKSLLAKIEEEYKPQIQKEKELREIKESLEGNVEYINQLQNQMNTLNTNMGSITNEIRINTEDLDNLKHSAKLLGEYKNELEVYHKKYSKVEKIKYYSSPSTGIQTLFMELYMNKIISISNELLSLLFGGEFTLQPFVINENEFRIPCMGNGLMHDDISSMSTAQKCMISMILSFSLLYQASTKYNIIKLDEIDAPLDTFNRSYFITLLNNIMGMLHCEQCFIVSHNNELNDCDSDLILLKSAHAEQFNGNIIWQY